MTCEEVDKCSSLLLKLILFLFTSIFSDIMRDTYRLPSWSDHGLTNKFPVSIQLLIFLSREAKLEQLFLLSWTSSRHDLINYFGGVSYSEFSELPESAFL